VELVKAVKIGLQSPHVKYSDTAESSCTAVFEPIGIYSNLECQMQHTPLSSCFNLFTADTGIHLETKKLSPLCYLQAAM